LAFVSVNIAGFKIYQQLSHTVSTLNLIVHLVEGLQQPVLSKYQDGEIKENKMGGAESTQRKCERFLQNVCWKALRDHSKDLDTDGRIILR
jgi:hypothetical protein